MVKQGKPKEPESECCDIFRALSVETRVRIIELLKTRGPLGPKKIAQLIGVTPAAVSQHLKTLKHVGLVRSERRGYWIPYEVDEGALEACRIKVSRVCSCGCHAEDMVVVKRGRADDRKSLEAYKRKLEAELRRVRERLDEMASEKGT
jgi:DNA-binding transcriptional ArsR family regulator